MSKAKIHYHDIGDYLTREEKLSIVKKFGSMGNPEILWTELKPNEHGDWIAMRNESFDAFIPMEPEKKFDLKTQTFFNTYAIGVATNRDAWVYNFSKQAVSDNMKRMIKFYNEQTGKFQEEKVINPEVKIEDYIDTNATKISWTRALRKDSEKNLVHEIKINEIRNGVYRPFTKQNLYFDKPFIESPGLSSILFPNNDSQNFIISLTGSGASKPFSALIGNTIPNLDNIEKSQCFPLYFYEENNQSQKGLFDSADESDYIRRDGVSDFILERATKQYGVSATSTALSGHLTKEDIFYYVYGFLHSPEYRETFANDLKKMLPRLPLVEDVKDFWAFSNAGRKLADLHLNYETVPAFDGVKVTEALDGNRTHYRVEKMRFPTGKKAKDAPDTIIYNSKISISNIPKEAYAYIVNGKSAIEWIMERYAVTTHKDSGIKNDPNDWADEVGNPRYILDLLLSIINVSVQTVGIVEGLPRVEFG
jgi:predicted helicase